MTIHERDKGGGVLELVIDQPPVNALTISDLHDLAARLRAVSGRPDVHVVLLRGEGRGFCGGGDVKEVQRLPAPQGILGQASGSQAASLAVAECAVPVVTAIHGYCIGVGCLVAGTADVIVAADDTRFVLAEVDFGATAGAVQALGLLPPKRMRAAMLTGEPVDASELFHHGSVFRLVPQYRLACAALKVAETIAAKPPQVMRRLKESLNITTGLETLRSRYRAELSYTYELNMLGEAARQRDEFLRHQHEE